MAAVNGVMSQADRAKENVDSITEKINNNLFNVANVNHEMKKGIDLGRLTPDRVRRIKNLFDKTDFTRWSNGEKEALLDLSHNWLLNYGIRAGVDISRFSYLIRDDQNRRRQERHINSDRIFLHIRRFT